MKIKNSLLICGVSLALSCGIISFSKKAEEARAESLDAGLVSISSIRNDLGSLINGWSAYLVPSQSNILPDDWDHAYLPVGEDSGIYVDGVKDNGAVIKNAGTGLSVNTIYLELSNHSSTNKSVTFKGVWEANFTKIGKTYRFTFEESVGTWNGTTWSVAPALDVYDKITLSDAGFEDKDQVKFDTHAAFPNAWNTYVNSSENTRNSFSLEFVYEAYSKSDNSLVINVGVSGDWTAGHHYRLALNNSWGPNGVMLFWECVGDTTIYHSGDIECNASPGQRHTIEFGSVYIKNSNDTFNFVKFDGSQLYGERRTPSSHDRTTKVSASYDNTNIFFGSVEKAPKENTQIIGLHNYDKNTNGAYLDGSLNSIPASWDVKGAPATNKNILLNGEPVNLSRTLTPPMVKVSSGEISSYYLSFADMGINLKEGDYVTLLDEFHFYDDGKTYGMNIIPVSFLFENNDLVEIDNLSQELLEKIENHVNPEYYEDDKVIEINSIIQEAQSELAGLTDTRLIWDSYHGFIIELDQIPISPEKYAELLAEAKENANTELDSFVSEDIYDETNLAIVSGIVNSAKEEIEAATDIDVVKQILSTAKEDIANQAKTKQCVAEEAIMASDELLPEYLEDYDVVTTTDFSAVGDMVFLAKDKGGYHSGAYDDTTSRFVSSETNLDGNMIFQFNYSSTNPNSREYGSQIFIRMRTDNASNSYRFDIATEVEEGHSGVALAVLQNDVGTQRITYDANFQTNTEYKIECGSIDLEGYARTLLFIKINDVMVLKQIVDSFKNQLPVIRIADSYTQDEEVARFSAIEEGTTKKDNNPTLLGRLILDNSSNKKNLYASLKVNVLPEGAILYPHEKGAFTINGSEVDTWRAETTVSKSGETKYRVDFNSAELADCTTVHVGGYFSYLDSELVKSVYRFFDAEFVYHADSDSWTQNVPTDRETLIYEAKETLSNYVRLADYSETNQQAIEELIELYSSKIDEAETEQIESTLEEGLAKIDAIPTLLEEAKAAAKAELASYRSPELYRDEEKAELSEILANAYVQIDSATDEASIASIVASAKSEIDQIKTAEQRDAEDLAAKKKSGKADVTALSGKLEMNRYSSSNQDALSQLTYKALADIDNATSLEQIEQIVAKYKADIMAVETNDGSTFNGETYTGGGSSEEGGKESGEDSGSEGESGEESHDNEEKGFFGRLLDGIKNFFRGIIDFFKNLFTQN